MLFAPGNGTINQSVDIAELLVPTQLQSSNCQRFAGAPEQLQCSTVLEIEFALQGSARCDAPDSQSGARRADLCIGVFGLLEQSLRPFGNSAGSGITHVINVSGSEIILRSQNIAHTIAMFGCSGDSSSIVSPGAWVGSASVTLWIAGPKRRFGPTIAGPFQSPYRPLRAHQ